MNVKTADIKELESYYEKSGNQLVVLYGRKECKKEELIREFVKDKKFFIIVADRLLHRISCA